MNGVMVTPCGATAAGSAPATSSQATGLYERPIFGGDGEDGESGTQAP